MENKTCCGFGHRQVYDKIDRPLHDILEKLVVEEQVSIFMTGGMEEFDEQFSHAVRSLKKKYPHISLQLIRPYFSKDLNEYKIIYEQIYDNIIIPKISAGAHYKAAIKLRNRWMIDRSDIVISYVFREFGGAYDAVNYARRQNKPVIEIPLN